MKKLEKYISKELFEKLEKFLGNYNHENDFVGGIIFNGNKIKFPVKAKLLDCLSRVANLAAIIESILKNENLNELKEQKHTLELFLKEIQDDIESAYEVPTQEEMIWHLQGCLEIVNELEEKLQSRDAALDLFRKKYGDLSLKEYYEISS